MGHCSATESEDPFPVPGGVGGQGVPMQAPWRRQRDNGIGVCIHAAPTQVYESALGLLQCLPDRHAAIVDGTNGIVLKDDEIALLMSPNKLPPYEGVRQCCTDAFSWGCLQVSILYGWATRWWAGNGRRDVPSWWCICAKGTGKKGPGAVCLGRVIRVANVGNLDQWLIRLVGPVSQGVAV